jgi:hypothetical protein
MATCDVRSTNLESWETSQLFPEDREKPRKSLSRRSGCSLAYKNQKIIIITVIYPEEQSCCCNDHKICNVENYSNKWS